MTDHSWIRPALRLAFGQLLRLQILIAAMAVGFAVLDALAPHGRNLLMVAFVSWLMGIGLGFGFSTMVVGSALRQARRGTPPE